MPHERGHCGRKRVGFLDLTVVVQGADPPDAAGRHQWLHLSFATVHNERTVPVSLGFGMSGKMSGDRVRRQVPQRDNVTAPRTIIITTSERPVIDLLAQIKVHSLLCYLTLDGITTFVRLKTPTSSAISFNPRQPMRATQALRHPFSRTTHGRCHDANDARP